MVGNWFLEPNLGLSMVFGDSKYWVSSSGSDMRSSREGVNRLERKEAVKSRRTAM